MEPGGYTYDEIISQPEAWAQALEVVQSARLSLESLLRTGYDQVLFTGCGSTYYLSLAGAALFQEITHHTARAVPGGELLLNPAIVQQDGKAFDKTLLIAISRSGSTTETVRAVEQFKRQSSSPVIAVTNYPDPPLARLADVALVIDKGQEHSVAQTRSFASMYVAAVSLAQLASGDKHAHKDMSLLPQAGRKLISAYQALAQQLGENQTFDRFYFLGSGIRYGLACEANLKMKEMTLTHSEAFHFLEFRHGPMSMVGESAVVVGLVSQKNYPQEMAVLQEMEAKGASLLTLGEAGTMVAFASGLEENTRAVLYLPVLQLVAYYRSLAKGLNPDQPHNLTAVVRLDL